MYLDITANIDESYLEIIVSVEPWAYFWCVRNVDMDDYMYWYT